jgi:hypothetical protein
MEILEFKDLSSFDKEIIKENLEHVFARIMISYDHKSTKKTLKLRDDSTFVLNRIGDSDSLKRAKENFLKLKKLTTEQAIREIGRSSYADMKHYIGVYYDNVEVIYRLTDDGTYEIDPNITVLGCGELNYNYNMGAIE